MQHLPGFVGREWVFDAYRHWLDQEPESRLFWLKAVPGVGKTAIAANLAARERSAIVATWFCDAKSKELRNPDQAIRSLAYRDCRIDITTELTAATVLDWQLTSKLPAHARGRINGLILR